MALNDQTTLQSPPPQALNQEPLAPQSNEQKSLKERTRNSMTRVGDNIDLINLYARLKDGYRIFEVMGNFISIGFSSFFANKLNPENKNVKVLENKLSSARTHLIDMEGKIEALSEHVKQSADDGMKRLTLLNSDGFSALKQVHDLENDLNQVQNNGKFYGNVMADVMNAAAQFGISKYSAWWEQKSLTRIFDGYIKQEQGITNVSYDNLKNSSNPIIQRATDYYDRKDKYRTLPDYFGLVRVVPLIGRMIGKESKFYQATKWMEAISGITLSLGAKTGFFAWYFLERQTGGYYQFKRIWNKTEGILNQDNRMYNQSITPGELVSQEEIAKVYREVAHDRKLPDFGRDDPLTGRIFSQIATYLNHKYIPKLLRDKKPDLNFKELDQTNFTFADLVELFGTSGININDAYATAVRIEVLAHSGFKDYREVDEKLKRFTRPEKTAYATQAEFSVALTNYMNKLDEIACDYLGKENWPKEYVIERIRPGLFAAHGVEPDYKFVRDDRREKVNTQLNIIPRNVEEMDEHNNAKEPQIALGQHTAKVLAHPASSQQITMTA